MNKKTFLDNLRKRLNVLNKDEIDDILKEYEGFCKKHIKTF